MYHNDDSHGAGSCYRKIDVVNLAIVTRLHAKRIRILNLPEVRERIVADGSEPVGSSPEKFRQFMLADLAKWAKVVKERGAKLG